MNILITNFHLKDGGGHKTYITYIVNFLKNNGINIYVASPRQSRLNSSLKRSYPNNVFDIEFPTKIKEISNLIRNILLLRKIIKIKNIDLIHVNGSPDHKVVSLTKWLFKFNYKIIRTKHDSFPIRNSYLNGILYSRYTNHLLLVSKFQENALRRDKNLLCETTVIQNGIDIDYYKPLKANKHLRKKLNISNGDFVMVSSAGTSEHKGWLFLYHALERLDQEIKDRVKVVLIGNTPNFDSLRKYNLQNFIFTGYMEDVREYVSIANVGFVLSYKVETISYACREMMAMAKPVIVSQYAGLPENVKDNVDGWIVDTSDIDSIVNVIKKIFLKDLSKQSKNARLKAEHSFDIKNKNIKLLDIYHG